MSESPALEQTAQALVRRFARGEVLRGALRFGTPAACLLGCAGLWLDLSFGALGLGIACAALVGGYRAWRSMDFDRDRALAWLDSKSGGDGLLVSLGELGPSNSRSAWGARLGQALERVPDSTARVGTRAIGGFALAVGFSMATLFMPKGTAAPSAGARPAAEAYGSELERLREALATLDESVELEPETADALRGRLEQLEAELSNLTAGELALEGLDRLATDLHQESQVALGEALGALDQMERAGAWAPQSPEAAAREIQNGLERLAELGVDENLAPSAREALRELAERMQARAQNASTAGDGERSALSDPEAVQALLEELAELAELRAELAQALAELAESLGDQVAAGDLRSQASGEAALTPEELRELIEALRDAQLDPAAAELARGGEP